MNKMTNKELLYNQLVVLPDDNNRNNLYLLVLNHLTEGEAQMIMNRFKKEINEIEQKLIDVSEK